MLPGRVPKRVRSRCLRFGAVATIALLIPPRIVAAQHHSGAATTAGSYTVVERPADQLRSTLAPEQLDILEKLNRVDVAHMARPPIARRSAGLAGRRDGLQSAAAVFGVGRGP